MQLHATRCSKVAQAVGDKMSLIELHSAAHVGAMAIHNVGTTVDAQVSKLTQVTTISTMEILSAVRQVTLRDSLRTTMEAYYHNIALLAQLFHYALHSGMILSSESITLMTKCTEAISHAINLTDAGFAILSASHPYSIIAQCLDSRLYGYRIEIVDMIVSNTQKIVAGIYKQINALSGHHE